MADKTIMIPPVGVAGGASQLATQATQATQAMLNNSLVWQTVPHLNSNLGPALAVAPMVVVAERKINQLIDQLPLRALARIARISFHNTTPMMFVVAYMDGHRLEFADIEHFPSDADVSKVLIELP